MKDNKWKVATKNDWSFLFPLKAMSKVYRGKFLEALKRLIDEQVMVPHLAPMFGRFFIRCTKKTG